MFNGRAKRYGGGGGGGSAPKLDVNKMRNDAPPMSATTLRITLHDLLGPAGRGKVV